MKRNLLADPFTMVGRIMKSLLDFWYFNRSEENHTNVVNSIKKKGSPCTNAYFNWRWNETEIPKCK